MAGNSYKKQHTEITSFGIYDFYDGFVVGEWTDEHATAQQVAEIKILFDHYFQGKAYGYIGNRVNPHSVDVADVRDVLRKAQNLKEVAFVIYSNMAQTIAYIEKSFYDSHRLHVYSDLEQAMQWMATAIEGHRSGVSPVEDQDASAG